MDEFSREDDQETQKLFEDGLECWPSLLKLLVSEPLLLCADLPCLLSYALEKKEQSTAYYLWNRRDSVHGSWVLKLPCKSGFTAPVDHASLRANCSYSQTDLLHDLILKNP